MTNASNDPKAPQGDGAGDTVVERRGPPSNRPSLPPPDGVERRREPRYDVTWAVDCDDGETFLYSYITNISAMGIFISSRDPLAVGTRVNLRFAPTGEEPMDLAAEVTWVNPWRDEGENLNPGFGVRFVALPPEARERLVSIIHAIAYLPDEVGGQSGDRS